MDPQNPPSLPTQKSGWYHRNWKWFVPLLCIAALVLFSGGILGIVAIVMGVMKSATPYRVAVAHAKADPRVANAIGQPLREGWFITGRIQTTGSSGRAALDIPISGSRGHGDIYVVATKSGGEWSYSTLEFRAAGSPESINLQENPR